MTFRHFRAGFTIVELLIVIVVIGILAALVISTFSGAQVRAENTKTIEALKSYVKAIALYAADNGAYPSTNAYPCLGDYPADRCANTTDTTAGCFGIGQTAEIASFNTLLAPYLGARPQPSAQKASCGGKDYVGMFMGPNNTDTSNANFVVSLRGNVECSSVGGARSTGRSQQDDLTLCRYAMPTL